MTMRSSTSVALCGLSIVGLCVKLAASEKIRFVRVKRGVIEERFQKASSRNGVRRKRLTSLFGEAGCQGDLLAEQKVKGSRFPNVICTLPGTSDSHIIVGAHFDTLPRSHGAIDNWSGSAPLPSLFQSLKQSPRKHTFVFIGFTDEEKGLKGSAYYAKQLTADEKAKTRAMVNLECLGLSPTKVWVSRSDPKLVQALDDVARAMKVPIAGVNAEKIGSSDFASFAKHEIPTITIHSLTQEALPILHTPSDTKEKIQFDHYYETYRLISAYLAFLDLKLE